MAFRVPQRTSAWPSGTSDAGLFSEMCNGSNWSLVPVANGQGLDAVSCLSTDFCMSGGENQAGSLAEEWNGSTWSVVPSPMNPTSSDLALYSVSCATTRLFDGAIDMATALDLKVADRFKRGAAR